MSKSRTRLMVKSADTLSLKPHVHLRFNKLRQAWVVLAPEHVYWPDDISVAILQKLDGKTDVGAIIKNLAEEYDAPEDAVRSDIIEFLQTWCDAQLIMERAG